MKRVLACGFVAALFLGAPAGARKPRAVSTTLYAHGAHIAGEVEMSTDTAAALTGEDVEYRTMNSETPAGTMPRSLLFFSDPRPIDCAGNWFAPTWVGEAAGRIKGTVKFTFHSIGQAGIVNVRLYNDVPGACDPIHKPFATIDVQVPSGQGKVQAVLRKVDVSIERSIMVSIFPLTSPMYSRILYDSVGAPTNLSFTCIPARGGKSCTPE